MKSRTLTSVAVIIPVLNRPHRVAPLVASILASDKRAKPLFLVSPGDADELAAVRSSDASWVVVDWPPGRGDYAKKINHGFLFTDDEWVFTGADDLHFHPGWFDACLNAHARTNACVIGTNDGGNPLVINGRHSTHSLVHRDYGECGTIDDSTKLLCELYDHNGVDVEFVETARWRRTFTFASDARVEHQHHLWRKAEKDDTYRKGNRAYAADQALLARRRRMWK